MSNSSPNTPWRTVCLLVLAGSAVSPGVAGTPGATRSGMLTVGARVRPMARIDSLKAPAVLVLTDADLARGWVDLPEPVEVEVRANTPDGWDLGLDLDTSVVLAVEIGGLGPAPVLVGSGARFAPAVTGPGRARLQLALRLHLSPGARPGAQTWPLRLSAYRRG